MSAFDPQTRHLSPAEVAEALGALRETARGPSSLQTQTTLFVRAPRPAVKFREPATVLEVPLGSHVEPVTPPIGDRAVELPKRTRSVTWKHMASLAVAVPSSVCVVWIVASRPFDAAPASETQVEPVRQSTQPVTPLARPAQNPDAGSEGESGTGRVAPSERVAVDLLLAGRTRDARDAYRALAFHAPERAEFASVTTLLERELATCAGEGKRCVRSAR